MATFIRYFTFIACGLMLIGLFLRRRNISQPAFVYGLSIAGLFLIQGLLQVLGGYASPFYAMLPWQQHPLAAVNFIIFLAWLWGVTAWVLFGGGAAKLANNGFGGMPQSPLGLKLFFIGFSLAAIPLFLVTRFMSAQSVGMFAP